MNFPPSTNFVRLPNVPYPYATSLHSSVLWHQVHPTFHTGAWDGIKILDAMAKDMGWPSRILNLSNFVLGKGIAYLLNRIFSKLGLAKQLPQEYNFDSLRASLSLLLNHTAVEFQLNTREQIMHRIGDDRSQQQVLMTKLAEVDRTIDSLMKERSHLTTEVMEARARFLTYQMTIPATLGWQSAFFSWLPSFIAGVLTSAVVYPLYSVGVWYTASVERTSWMGTMRLFREKVRNSSKSPYDGFLLQGVNVFLRAWLTIPPMMVAKRVMNVPDELEMRYHLNYLLVSVVSRDLNLTGINGTEHKQQVKQSFNAVISNSVAFTIADWAASLAMYPLLAVRNRLVCQGMPGATYQYGSTRDAFQTMYDLEGWQGFYSGITTRALAIIPELAMWAVARIAGNLLIDHYCSDAEKLQGVDRHDNLFEAAVRSR